MSGTGRLTYCLASGVVAVSRLTAAGGQFNIGNWTGTRELSYYVKAIVSNGVSTVVRCDQNGNVIPNGSVYGS